MSFVKVILFMRLGWLLGEEDDFHIFIAIIKEIRDTIKRPGRATLQHTLREANFVADSLAKLGELADDPALDGSPLQLGFHSYFLLIV